MPRRACSRGSSCEVGVCSSAWFRGRIGVRVGVRVRVRVRVGVRVRVRGGVSDLLLERGEA